MLRNILAIVLVLPLLSGAQVPDSRHLAYEASLAVKWVVVVDGVPTANQFDGFFRSADLVFDTPTRLHTVAGRRHELMRVNIKIFEP